MKNKKVLVIVFSICLISFGNWFFCKSQTANQENMKSKEMENYLRTADIVSIEKDESAGRTAPWRINLDDGKIARQGHFKHVNRLRPSLFPADSYKYDIAAYELDKLLDLNIVPPIVEREIEGTKGSLQLFLEGIITENERKMKNIDPPDLKVFKNNLEVINIFENLVYDEDCLDPDDNLINMEDWRVWRVDFSMAFSLTPELIPGCKITRCSKKLYKNLQKLESEAVKAKLNPYLNDEEIEALLKRKNVITDTIQQLIKEKGEASVLFQ